MGIARQSIEDLKKRSKISDFILATTSGKLRGTKGMALCPFHGEKNCKYEFYRCRKPLSLLWMQRGG